MARNNKISTKQLFNKISAYSSIVQQFYDIFMGNSSPYGKEYESTLDLILDILRARGYSEERLIREILEIVTGDATIGAAIENAYHGSIDSLESKFAKNLENIENKEENNSFIFKLEDAVKVTISTILTSLLSCSVSPFIPYNSLDKVYKSGGYTPGQLLGPINIPTHILDFSNTLHVSPVSESGIYFYNTGVDIKYYQRDDGVVEESTATIADIKDRNAEKFVIYNYEQIDNIGTLTDEQKRSFKKVVSVPNGVKVNYGEPTPPEFIYTVRPGVTAEGLYKTDDMNAFIWYVANRGDNFDESTGQAPEPNTMYEYNKMAWDSRRINNRDEEDNRRSANPEYWQNWLSSRKTWSGDGSDFVFVNSEGKEVQSLYPILQFEPSEAYGHLEHIIATFPAQRYLRKIKFGDTSLNVTRTIYKFNADYLKSIKIFNWKTIIMNMLYELNGICPIPDIQFNLSLSDEIIDARLSTLILNTITADDKEIDDSYYSFSNDDYSEAMKRMEIKKYSAKSYNTAGGEAIQNAQQLSLDSMNSVSTASSLNEITSTITRGVYSIAGTSGSTGVTKTELSYNLSFESNFVQNLLFAIVKPFVRALLSPQIMLLFCINLDVMGLVNLKDLAAGDMDAVQDFIFRKISGIIKKLIIQIKDMIVLYLLDIVKEEIKKLIKEVATMLLLEQLDDYIRLLNQILDCIRKYGTIGITLNGIDEVNYADIIPEAKIPES